ncbi:MAG: Ig-like domain-containing protein [Eubacterium sp.]|nr:Ig-like domain-containing protein [Eubacterium sp.]
MKKTKLMVYLLTAAITVTSVTPAIAVPVLAVTGTTASEANASQEKDAEADLLRELSVAREAAETTEQEVKTAQAAKEAAEKQAADDAEAEKTAQQQKETAAKASASAAEALEDAKSALETANQKASESTAALAYAQTEEQAAYLAAEEAQKVYDEKLIAAKTTEEAYEAAAAAVEEKKTEKIAADEKAEKAHSDAETAVKELASAQSDYDAKKAASKEKDQQAVEADTALAAAKETAEKASNELEVKSAAVEVLQTDYETAKVVEEKGSYGFFKSNGDTAAMNVLTGCTYVDKIKLGDPKDATSLDNMKKSFAYIRYLNELRKSLGLGELKVNSTMMAYAQADADYSDTVIGHAKQFEVGENLAWNYGTDPFAQWYNKEKGYFDAAAKSLGQENELTGEAAYNYYTNNETAITNYVTTNYGKSASVGHYTNDIRPDYKITGYAVTDRGTQYPWTHAQVFYFSTSEKTYTVDEYEALFQKYKEGIDQKISAYETAVADKEAAQKASTEAAAAVAQAEEICQKVKTEAAAAKAEIASAEERLETAKAKEAGAKQQETSAVTEAENAAEALKQAEETAAPLKEEKDAANDAVQNAESALAEAKSEQEEASAVVQAAQENDSKCQEVLAAAENRKYEAEKDQQEKEKESNEAETAYQEASGKAKLSGEVLSAAEEKFEKAKEADEAAQKTLQMVRGACEVVQTLSMLESDGDEAKAAAARAAYSSLSEEQKQLIGKEFLSILENKLAEAENAVEEAKKDGEQPGGDSGTNPQNPNDESAGNEEKTLDENLHVKVSRITLSGISKKIAAGKKIQLTAEVLPASAANKGINWITSNKKVATVTQNGIVTTNKKARGKKVKITAVAADGSGVKAVYTIKVVKGVVKKVSLKSPKKIVKAGKTLKLKASVKATKGANKKLKWTSSNVKWATVSSSGKVKTLKAGKGKTVKITAMATDGSGKKKTVKIKIQ